MNEESLIFAIIAIVVIAVATAIAPKLKIAGPLILVIVGLGVSLLPFVPAITVNPDLILVGVLPPLLYSAAVSLPAIEFRRDFWPIAGLAVILVAVSAIVLALFFRAMIPGLDFLLALGLGAILSPTDAVATSIAKRMGLGRRVITMLEGESLLNDATSLVLLRTAVAASVVGTATAMQEEAAVARPGFFGAFVWGVLVALIVGGIIGWVNLRVRALISNPAANTAIGLVVPFAAFLPTEQLGGSGLVAAVVAGIVTGQGAARRFTPEQRLSDELNWRMVEVVLEGAVFLLMGLELKEIVRANGESESGIWHGVWLAAAALGILLAVRAGYVAILVWGQALRARRDPRRARRLDAFSQTLDVVAAAPPTPPPGDKARDPAHLQRRVGAMRRRLMSSRATLAYYRDSPIGWKEGAVIVWAGMRGVVTLAAAQTLPAESPERPLLVFVAFLVAVGSLILQGFTLGPLVRVLRIEPADESLDRNQQARLDLELRQAAAATLTATALRRDDGTPFPADLVEKASSLLVRPPDEQNQAFVNDLLGVRIAMIEAMRARLVELSSGGQYSSANLRHALAQLDADQLSLQIRLDEA
ncbi:sodium:proton antiporter [Microbacterium sp. BWT-B31]|uniref:cation:proton antiporter n=1 Tax=Microbacterium sp. BWT-B31 TaxID=3232072 RepID=UPI0035293145